MRPKPERSFLPGERQQGAGRYLGKYAARSLSCTTSPFQISDFGFRILDFGLWDWVINPHSAFRIPKSKYPSQANTAWRPFPCMFFLLQKGLRAFLRQKQQA